VISHPSVKKGISGKILLDEREAMRENDSRKGKENPEKIRKKGEEDIC